MSDHYRFIYDERLGIRLPELDLEWDQYSEEEQTKILLEWEMIRGTIPERIRSFEAKIKEKQSQLDEEEDFAASCRLNSEIAELASCIHDLQLWYRIDQSIEIRRNNHY